MHSSPTRRKKEKKHKHNETETVFKMIDGIPNMKKSPKKKKKPLHTDETFTEPSRAPESPDLVPKAKIIPLVAAPLNRSCMKV
jgi:hypothetical protein